MKYIRVYNESASPVILKGLNRAYVVNGRTGRDPMIEDIPADDVYYINGKSDVFRVGRLRFDDAEADAIMEELRNPNWRDTVMTSDMIDELIMTPTNDSLRRIIDCTSRPQIERYRAAMVSLQNANRGVADIVSRVIRERYSEIANGITTSRIVLPGDERLKHYGDKGAEERAELKKENAEMKSMLEAMQKQLAALQAAQAKADKPEKPKTTRTKAPKAEPTAE